jgi:protocatechuate 3,4-dioxygenase beta subunit
LRKVLTVAVLALINVPSGLSDCKCARPEKGETTHWGGNEMIVVIERAPYKHLRGTIESSDGRPVDGALVEIFNHPEYLLNDLPNEKRDRSEQQKLAACRTKADGKFCFRGLAAGTYELRSSIGTGWDVTHVHVSVDPKKGKSEEFNVRMHLGT